MMQIDLMIQNHRNHDADWFSLKNHASSASDWLEMMQLGFFLGFYIIASSIYVYALFGKIFGPLFDTLFQNIKYSNVLMEVQILLKNPHAIVELTEDFYLLIILVFFFCIISSHQNGFVFVFNLFIDQPSSIGAGERCGCFEYV